MHSAQRLPRALEVAMPSASRYLATVRRATCTPSAASSSTICWSERLVRRLLGDQFPDLGTDRRGRNAGSVLRGHVAREKEAEFETRRGACAGISRSSRAKWWTRASRWPRPRPSGSWAAWTPRRGRGKPAGARRSCARPGAWCRCGSRGCAAASAPPAAACAATAWSGARVIMPA